MKDFKIRGRKGAYTKLLKKWMELDISKRVYYDLSIIKDTFDQIVTFMPKIGDNILPEDVEELKRLIRETENNTL